jgi:hypothetical protein
MASKYRNILGEGGSHCGRNIVLHCENDTSAIPYEWRVRAMKVLLCTWVVAACRMLLSITCRFSLICILF